MEECEVTKNRFKNLRNNREEKITRIFNDVRDAEKGKAIKKLWKEKEKRCKIKTSKRMVN